MSSDFRFGASRIGISLVALAMIFIVGMGMFLYYYLYLRGPAPDVGLEIMKPDRVLVGEPFTLTVSYTNNSDNILKDARLFIALPEAISLIDGAGERVHEEAIGDVGPGSIGKKEVNLIATGGEQSLERIEIRLEYKIREGSGPKFESETNIDISIGQSAVSLSFETPQNVFSGEHFEMVVNYENTSKKEFRGVELTLEYPTIFRFIESDVPPVLPKNNVWNIGTLEPGKKGSIRIKGNVTGQEASFFNARAELTGDFSGKEYTLNVQQATVGISSAPLSLRVSVNDSESYVGSLDEQLHYELRYRNNSEVALQDIVASAKLVGEMYDFSRLRTKGSFNSLTNTVSWNVGNIPELSQLNPGEERILTFDVDVRDEFPIRRLSDRNYSLKADAKVESPTVPPGVSADKTIAVVANETKIAGKTDLTASGYFYDPDSGILNKGPYPPRVNQPTQYTVHWKIVNYATDIQNIRLSAFLQSGAKFTGIVKSNVDSKPAFNGGTGEMTWDIASIPATKGIVSAPIEAVFQVEVTPAVNQVGQDILFLGDTRLTGLDAFVNKEFQVGAAPLTTALPHDTRINVTDKRVQP